MLIIEAKNFIVKEGRRAFVFAKPDEDATTFLKTGEMLDPLNIEPGDELLLKFRDPSENDDGFKLFPVKEGEKVFAIATIASLSKVG